MRLTAFALVALLVSSVAADEPKKNPFRNGAATPEVKKPDAIKQGPRVLRAAEAGVGVLIPNFGFTDLAAKAGKLSDFKSEKLLVVAFTDVGCPVAKKYGPTLAKLEKDFGEKGVTFLFVDPMASDEAEDLKKAVVERGLTGRTVLDKDGKLTAGFGAKTTTEVFVLDAARTVLYRGAIDDQYGVGYSLDAPKNHYLAAAIKDALAGKQPLVAATSAPGCELATKPLKATGITYHARIERIVQANCIECHNEKTRKGNLSIATLKDAIKGGDEGTTLVPGKPDESRLYTKIVPAAADAAPEMPKNKPALSSDQAAKPYCNCSRFAVDNCDYHNHDRNQQKNRAEISEKEQPSKK